MSSFTFHSNPNPLEIELILKNIFLFLSLRDLLSVRLVCQCWNHSIDKTKISQAPILLHNIIRKGAGDDLESHKQETLIHKFLNYIKDSTPSIIFSTFFLQDVDIELKEPSQFLNLWGDNIRVINFTFGSTIRTRRNTESKDFVRIFRNCPNLEELSIQKIWYYDLQSNENSLKEDIELKSRLKKLQLHCFGVVDSIASLLAKCPELQVFSLEDNYTFETEIPGVINALSRISSLREINLPTNYTTSMGLFTQLSLNSLSILKYDFSKDGIGDFNRFLTSQSESMESLCIEGWSSGQTPNDDIIFPDMPRLKRLKLELYNENGRRQSIKFSSVRLSQKFPVIEKLSLFAIGDACNNWESFCNQ